MPDCTDESLYYNRIPLSLINASLLSSNFPIFFEELGGEV